MRHRRRRHARRHPRRRRADRGNARHDGAPRARRRGASGARDDGAAALGHRRLAIVDLSPAGRAPDEQRGRHRPGDVQRRDLQPRRAARRARGARARLPHRAATPRCWSTSTRSTATRWSTGSIGMFAFGDVGRAPAPAVPGARPAGDQAAVLDRRRPALRLRVGDQGAAAAARAPRDRPDRAVAVPDVRRRPAAAHDVRRRAEARARPARWSSTPAARTSRSATGTRCATARRSTATSRTGPPRCASGSSARSSGA